MDSAKLSATKIKTGETSGPSVTTRKDVLSEEQTSAKVQQSPLA